MFNVNHLNDLRAAELELVISELRPGSRILEFGAGTGEQARSLSLRGYEIEAIDLAQSTYSQSRVYPVCDYDGSNIPLSDGSVDIIFSSNVLEHIEDLPKTMSEFKRVLRPGGYCVHILPSVAWRFWTFISGYLIALTATIGIFFEVVRIIFRLKRYKPLGKFLRLIVDCLLPSGHGTSVEGISELWTYSIKSWNSKFLKNGFRPKTSRPSGLFYTGHMLIGARLSAEKRKLISKVLGSATNVFIVEPITGAQ